MSCSNSSVHADTTLTRWPRDKGAVIQDFYGLMDWLRFLETPIDMPNEMRVSQQQGLKAKDYGIAKPWKEWAGTASWEETINLAKDGWPEGTERVARYTAKLDEDLIGLLHQPEVQYDVLGDQLDIGRYVNGEPEEFMSLVPAEVERSPMLLKMAVNFAASQSIPTETMIERGATAVALVDALERHGKRVQLDAVTMSARPDLTDYQRTVTYVRPGEYVSTGYVLTRIRLKDFETPVQLANLIYVLAHPSAHRRLAFCSWEHVDADIRASLGIFLGAEYGYPDDLQEDVLDGYDIYIPALSSTRRVTMQAGVEYILAELSKQGIYAQKEVMA